MTNEILQTGGKCGNEFSVKISWSDFTKMYYCMCVSIHRTIKFPVDKVCDMRYDLEYDENNNEWEEIQK